MTAFRIQEHPYLASPRCHLAPTHFFPSPLYPLPILFLSHSLTHLSLASSVLLTQAALAKLAALLLCSAAVPSAFAASFLTVKQDTATAAFNAINSNFPLTISDIQFRNGAAVQLGSL